MALVADVVLAIHALFVLFVVLGQLLVLLGWARKWSWVRRPWFRYLHLLAVGFVVLETWFGIACPLTRLENALRVAAHGAPYATSFVGHWLQQLIFYEAPPAVFTAVYTAFFVLVLVSFFAYPPRAGKSRADQGK